MIPFADIRNFLLADGSPEEFVWLPASKSAPRDALADFTEQIPCIRGTRRQRNEDLAGLSMQTRREIAVSVATASLPVAFRLADSTKDLIPKDFPILMGTSTTSRQKYKVGESQTHEGLTEITLTES